MHNFCNQSNGRFRTSLVHRVSVSLKDATADTCVQRADAGAALECIGCGASVGVEDEATQSYNLSKRALALSTSPKDPRQSFPDQLWLSCQLLTTAHHQGLRKLQISGRQNGAEPLLVWLFAPDLTISSSATSTPQPRRVAKVMWKRGKAVPAQDLLNQQSLSEGELELSLPEMEALQACLLRSLELMPVPARTFLDWNVGLLGRFSSTDLL